MWGYKSLTSLPASLFGSGQFLRSSLKFAHGVSEGLCWEDISAHFSLCSVPLPISSFHRCWSQINLLHADFASQNVFPGESNLWHSPTPTLSSPLVMRSLCPNPRPCSECQSLLLLGAPGWDGLSAAECQGAPLLPKTLDDSWGPHGKSAAPTLPEGNSFTSPWAACWACARTKTGYCVFLPPRTACLAHPLGWVSTINRAPSSTSPMLRLPCPTLKGALGPSLLPSTPITTNPVMQQVTGSSVRSQSDNWNSDIVFFPPISWLSRKM